ncbi:uncharacterized protein YALI1_E26450g [Yarrowia lipolytica]|uniref:Uncharacterized protein n=1 Tax=Yarrowia lipolytica TaxID=4952 RepID=A0A1D8NJH9_YARLL|nr:hypothetical protein YALI1_E26450g [Yarrowia lipolytica]
MIQSGGLRWRNKRVCDWSVSTSNCNCISSISTLPAETDDTQCYDNMRHSRQSEDLAISQSRRGVNDRGWSHSFGRRSWRLNTGRYYSFVKIHGRNTW